MRNYIRKAHTSHLAADSNMRCAWNETRNIGKAQELWSATNILQEIAKRLIPRPVSEFPFQHTDLDKMTLDGRKYLFCKDYFSDYTNRAIGLMTRVFANGQGDRVSTQAQQMVLATTLLNTQYYKVRIKGKVEHSREWSSAPLHHSVVAIEKGSFGSPSTKVANFTFTFTL